MLRRVQDKKKNWYSLIEEKCNGIPCTEHPLGKVSVTIINYSEELKIFQSSFPHDPPARM